MTKGSTNGGRRVFTCRPPVRIPDPEQVERVWHG